VSTPEKALAQRIKELRRRHFGPRGKGEFASRLEVPLEEYERFERGKLPPGDLMVRMCEVTGEDLQWLLTGVAARGTVVISGARGRHQQLLAQVAQALEARPELAPPLEAFLDLLQEGEQVRPVAPSLPAPRPDELIPLFGPAEWPEELPDPDGPGSGHTLAPVFPEELLGRAERWPASLAEPAMEYRRSECREVTLLAVPDATGSSRQFVQSSGMVRCFPAVFGVVLDDDAMEPMFAAGDSLLVAAGAGPRIGQPALCKFADRAQDRCRIWLGEDEQHVYLGRVSDGEHEELSRAQFRWSLEVLYRVARAA
jgi:hypothetical protein